MLLHKFRDTPMGVELSGFHCISSSPAGEEVWAFVLTTAKILSGEVAFTTAVNHNDKAPPLWIATYTVLRTLGLSEDPTTHSAPHYHFAMHRGIRTHF